MAPSILNFSVTRDLSSLDAMSNAKAAQQPLRFGDHSATCRFSGVKESGPERQTAQAHEFDAVVVWKLVRLGGSIDNK
jgi:hypothetical protein